MDVCGRLPRSSPTRRLVLKSVLRPLAVLAVLLAGVWWTMIRMPGRSHSGPLPALTPDQVRVRDVLRTDVKRLAEGIGDRNAACEYDRLAAAADFVASSFESAGHRVSRQEFELTVCSPKGRICSNIEAELPGRTRAGEIVVIGAHYDSLFGTPGANDNASGVAALLALARAFAGRATDRTLRFVGFANEEPPFFLTPDMGSVVYARRCKQRGENVVAMLSLETVGYYSDQPGSQKFPVRLLGLVYPSTGNFIGFVGNLKSGRLVRDAVGSFRRHARFPSEGAAVPAWIPGAGWSDHWAFWQEGYPAVMVTDTAPFRYPHYHQPSDTPDRLDYDPLARVVSGLEGVVGDLAGTPR